MQKFNQMERTGRSFEKLIDKNKKHDDPLQNLDIKLVRKEFGDKRFNELLSIVNKYDPLQLIALAAPINEYDLEVKTIIVQLDDCNTEEEIYHLVLGEFTRWFGEIEEEDLGLFEKMSIDIHDWKSKNGTRDLYGEYLSKAESFLKDNTADSDMEAYYWFRLAYVLDLSNRELENIVNTLDYKIFGDPLRDFFDDDEENG